MKVERNEKANITTSGWTHLVKIKHSTITTTLFSIKLTM